MLHYIVSSLNANESRLMTVSRILVALVCCSTLSIGQQHAKGVMPQPFRTFDLKNFADQLPKQALHKQWGKEVTAADLNDDPLQRLAFPADDRLILYST